MEDPFLSGYKGKSGNSVITFKGHHFDILNPDPSKVDIVDIAVSLGNQCRFNGHVFEFISVAQHSVIVAERLRSLGYSAEVCYQGLLHDASEAYVGDLVSPIKRVMPDYRDIEDKVFRCVAQALGFDPELPEAIHSADYFSFVLERTNLQIGFDQIDEGLHELVRGIPFKALSPRESTGVFLQTFEELRDCLGIFHPVKFD